MTNDDLLWAEKALPIFMKSSRRKQKEAEEAMKEKEGSKKCKRELTY